MYLWTDVINVKLQLFKGKLGVVLHILSMLFLMKQLNLNVLMHKSTNGQCT